jgi:hypothetical protein
MRVPRFVVELIVGGCAVAATAWITAYVLGQDLRRFEVDDTLRPIAALLADNARILDSLKHDGIAASESVLLGVYLQNIRRDGVAKHAATKQRIDTISNNNATVVALLGRYAAHARSPEFRVAAAKFVEYAIRFRDRWQSVFEIFMAGGDLPPSGPQTPPEFASAVTTEALTL